jgi:hypothetical protein
LEPRRFDGIKAGAPASWFDAFSSREPVLTLLENASMNRNIEQGDRQGSSVL